MENIESLLNRARIMINCNEIFVHHYNLPCNIGGFVYYSMMKNYYIIINFNLNKEYQEKILLHEIKHVLDFKDTGLYIFETNGEKISNIERDADEFVQLATNLAMFY
jgi:Zn-dependent peptidase ImmA (M78 family)